MPNTITQAGGLGEAVTPEQWASFVLEHLQHASVVLRSGVTRIDTDSKQIHVPRLTDDGGADWYDELEELGTDAPDADTLTLTPKKCAALVVVGNESVSDSDPSVLDQTGRSMLRAVGREVDRALLKGEGGKQPVGVLEDEELEIPSHPGDVDYEGLVRASGLIRAAGGEPDVAYISPLDLVELQLEEDGHSRPLISDDPTGGPPPVVAGLRLYVTPTLDEGEALVAEARQLVVAVRRDAEVAFSSDAAFDSDGTMARVIARADGGVNDVSGLATIGFGS